MRQLLNFLRAKWNDWRRTQRGTADEAWRFNMLLPPGRRIEQQRKNRVLIENGDYLASHYICRKCWLATAISAGSGEPMCECEQPKVIQLSWPGGQTA